MTSLVEQPAYAERYGKNELNFARTTEGANVLACMPFADELSQFDRLEYLAIAGAGQILDTLALVETQNPGSIERVDLIDDNPCQLLCVARMLWAVASSDTCDNARNRLLTATPTDVEHEWHAIFQTFPDLTALRKHKGIRWDAFNRNLAGTCNDRPRDAGIPLSHVSPQSLRQYVLQNDQLFGALKGLVIRQPRVFHFHEASFEHFTHPEGRTYQAIYGSDIHAWTSETALLGTLQSQLAPGGMAMFTLYGSTTPEEDEEHRKRDTSFLAEIRASDAFVQIIYTPLDIQQRLETVKAMLNIENGAPWEQFVLDGSGGLPVKQTNVLRLVKKEEKSGSTSGMA
ncbi:hypothetical protein A2973_04120 [Candidatus Gottesmanbacteria bacterium RIFCSPLOWO2_01_FULL_49_10]|uniref:DUF4470 domain-containing protein n=1 Tax=Candidatus Gottesmanbacteria bacterium RIFCSPLOWO2_01_FULL_49_10 TaxID=1798396 RepID=A0A1F6B0Q2_9BACT|nr:MAG: hypothetical protein A2973_04120 [Candidatus Gottesmanbacteria bacterium RIFCSPLOWO2_01_FULL_49_10]